MEATTLTLQAKANNNNNHLNFNLNLNHNHKDSQQDKWMKKKERKNVVVDDSGGYLWPRPPCECKGTFKDTCPLKKHDHTRLTNLTFTDINTYCLVSLRLSPLSWENWHVISMDIPFRQPLLLWHCIWRPWKTVLQEGDNRKNTNHSKGEGEGVWKW